MGITTSAISRLLTSSGNRAAYLFDREALTRNHESLSKAFLGAYGNFRIAYSFKTNYLREICLTLKELGVMAEVVSPNELYYAERLAFTPDQTVYNGVIPDIPGKFLIAAEGGCVNVDNLPEYAELSKFAEAHEKPIRIGVRVNIDIGNGLTSRFGLDVTGDDFQALMGALENDPYMTFGGFHCHIGTSRPVRYWETKAKKMIELCRKYGASYLDLGGGMFGPMPQELAGQFTEYEGSFQAYADATARLMKEAFPDERVTLIVEPGTALVGDAMSVVAVVTDVKTVRGQAYVTVNCCSNQAGFICDCKDIPLTVFPTGSGGHRTVENGIIAGNTCLEFDYLRKGVSGEFGIGDAILFRNLGAYSLSCSRQFIVPRLGVYDAHSLECLREAETPEDMFRNYLAT